MLRKRNCEVCGGRMEYEPTRGMDRKYCSTACRYVGRKKILDGKFLDLPECKTNNCKNRANRVGAGLCEACYMRLRRRGTVEKKTYPYKSITPAGYVALRESAHPLSVSNGAVYEHRFVYYEANGEGPFDCHWCHKEVNWDNLHIDHLDCNKINNHISNLAATCPACNMARGLEKMKRTLDKKATRFTFCGVTLKIDEWAKELGISRASFMWRINNGWPKERVFTEPRGKFGPLKKGEENG